VTAAAEELKIRELVAAAIHERDAVVYL